MTPDWIDAPVAPGDAEATAAARRRQRERLKPPGSLGALEGVAIRLAGLQGSTSPRLDTIAISVFCGDHGVVAEGVSAYPASITRTMAARFTAGGTAIGVLARELGAALEAVDTGMLEPAPAEAGVIDARAGAGAANWARTAAMTPDQCAHALQSGREAAERARTSGAEAFLGGEMGIGNSATATALACVLLERSPAALAGPGAGLDDDGVRHKAAVIERGLARHGRSLGPLDALAALGGFEIAALAGAYVASAQRRLPILVDGFIASVAALVAQRLAPGVGQWLIATHRSAEPGHDAVLAALGAEPLLDLGMRLGEGSGAAVAVPLMRSACALHREMASLADAGIAAEPDPP